MTTSNNEYAAVVSRAHRRFPDHKLDVAFQVCLPVYEVRLRIIEMAEHELSTSARFILQLSNLDVAQPAELGRLLGLSDRYVAEAAAELLNDGLVVQRPDQGIEITDKGREVLNSGGRSLRPRNRHPRVPYDYLTKRILEIDTKRLLERNVVRKEGLFVVPAKLSRPRLSNIRIDEVRDYDSIYTQRRDPTEILEIANIKDMWLKYRYDVVLVKLDEPGSGRPTFAAYGAHQYLEEESSAIQRLADSGTDLVPDEFKSAGQSLHQVSSVSASSEETSLISDIAEIHSEVVEKDLAVAEARATQGTTQNAQERADLASRIDELEAEKLELTNRLAEREDKLNTLAKGETRLIRTEEHRHLLLQAIDQASSQLTLVSAWIDPYAFDDEICRRLAAAIGRGVTVRIAWGLGTRRRGREADRNRLKGNSALSKLKRLVPKDRRKQLIEKVTETHEKFIICDGLFCAWGSFNWLSYRGQRDEGYRRETSYYSERQADITLWKENATSLFRS